MNVPALLPRPRIAMIPSAMYARACDWIETLGIERDVVLGRAGISAATMESVDGLLTLGEVEAFVDAAVGLVQAPGRAVEFGGALLFPSFGEMGMAALTAPTVEEALDTAVRFFDLITPLFRLEHQRHQAYYEFRLPLRYALRGEALRVHIDVVVTSVSAMVRTGVASGLDGFELDLPIPDRPLVDWAGQHRVKTRLGAPVTAIRYPAEVAQKKLTLSDPRAHERFVARCEHLLTNRKVEDQTIRQVRGRLRGIDPPFPDLDALSGSLGASPRTIRRRLEHEGVCFRQLLDEARFSWASEALCRARDITSIAYDLGFSSPESFSRSFRRRVGMSPSAYRKASRD